MSQIYLEVQTFLDSGGPVLLAIGAVLVMMWTLMIERFYYFYFVFPGIAEKTQREWNSRRDHSSWEAHKIRDLLISQVRMGLEQRLWPIETAVSLCPLLGLLGTVTGMIEVFDVMSLSGSSNARGMASGVSKATLPTMAGMVAALSGMLISVQLRKYALDEGDRIEDRLEIEHV